MSPRVITLLMDIGLVVTWSSGFIGGKLASATDSIFLVLFWRFVITTLILLPFTFKSTRFLSWRILIQQMVIGSLAMFGYLGCVVAAIHLGVPAALVALIAALQPLATAALAGPVLKQDVGKLEWLGLFIGFAGVAVSVAGNLEKASALGFGLALLSMLCLVAGTLLTKRVESAPSLGSSMTIQSFTTAILFAPLALYIDNTLMFSTDIQFWKAVMWFVLLSTLAAYGLYWGCVERVGAVNVACLIYLSPPVTALWALVMFNEAIATATIAGFVISVAGIMLSLKNSNHDSNNKDDNETQSENRQNTASR